MGFNLAFRGLTHGHCRGTAWTLHAMCESSFKVPHLTLTSTDDLQSVFVMN
jgi:hypothetical protein